MIVSCFPDAFISENTIFIAVRKEVKALHLTLNVLLSLLIQAKRQGKGKIGNGRMLIMLLQIIADSSDPEQTQERNLLRIFTDEPAKNLAYQKIDKQLAKFIPNGKPYPYKALYFTRFERTIGDLPAFGVYLMRMHRCCQEIIAPEKAESLAYTLIGILRADTAFSDILYGERYLPKSALFGSPAHPRKLCLPALLLGLLYQLHRSAITAETPVQLMQEPPLLHFHLVNPAGSYRNRTNALRDLLNPEAPVTLRQSLSDTAAKLNITENKDCFPVELRSKSGQFISFPETGDVFLYGAGGIGKSTFLHRLKAEQTAFILPLYSFHTQNISAYHPDQSIWILLQILLKYHYQNCCMTYETCAANEGSDTILRLLHELEELLAMQPVNGLPNYTLMLDGINEVPPDERSALFDEIEHICKKWRNVRIIISGRSIPPAPLFQRFQPIEMCGIADAYLQSHLPAETDRRCMELLKTPLFLEIYSAAESSDRTMNRACMIDAYVNRLIETTHNKSEQPILRFLVLYALPFAANFAAQKQQMFLDRADLSAAIERAYDIFVCDERICQNLLYPQQITKKSLPIGSDRDELIDLLTEQFCLIQTETNDRRILRFSHQYFRDFFAAKYIINLLKALLASYADCTEKRAELFSRYRLGHIWYPEEMRDIYRLIGELAGDDRNQADDDFIYHETILDAVLDWSRQFDTFRVTENIIRTMAAVRKNVICGVNFSGTTLPLYLPCNLKFSRNDADACDFIHCQVNLIGLTDGNICCMTKSPDGKTLLLALEDQYALLLDAESNAVLHEFDFSDENSPWSEFDTAGFSQDSQICAVVLNGNPILIDVQTGNIICTDKPLSDYGISLPDETPYPEKQPIEALGTDFLSQLYRNLPHFRGCDFTDAVFLIENTKEFLQDLGAEF